MQVRHGPAAVSGDLACTYATGGKPMEAKPAGKAQGTGRIRESEDLPRASSHLEEMANPQAVFTAWGFFLAYAWLAKLFMVTFETRSTK